MGRRDQSRWIADMAGSADVPVVSIEAGKRAFPGKGRRGRPPKAGERYPSGQLKPHQEADRGLAPAHWRRIVNDAIAFSKDPRIASELARQQALGNLSATQVSSGFRLAEVYGRYERMMGLRRSAKSAAYDAGHGDPDLDEARMTGEQLDELRRRQESVLEQFKHVQAAIPATPRHARALIEQLCVEDRLINPVHVRDVGEWLGEIAKSFGERWRRRKPGPTAAKRKPLPEATPAAPVARKTEPSARIGMRMIIARLRPDLCAEDLEKAVRFAVEFQAAAADRERFRVDKRRV